MLRKRAMDLLARREHSRFELNQKLRRRLDDEVVEHPDFERALNGALDGLEADNLLSDERFVESYVRVRRDKGYGPMHIRQALQQRRVSPELIEAWLDEHDADWVRKLRLLVDRKAGDRLPEPHSREWLKLQRFLTARGFTPEQISRVFRSG